MATSVTEPQKWTVSHARRPGWVNVFGAPHACMVSDLSSAGALLTFTLPTEVPAKFALHLSNAELYHCRVRSKDGLSVTVLFEPPAPGPFH